MAGKQRYTPFELAARLLGRRMYTRQELFGRLKKEGFLQPDIAQVLDTFERDGYIDDQAFIERYINDRRRFNPRGSHALYSELLRRGIPRAMLAGFRETLYPLSWEADDACRLLRQWTSSVSCDIGDQERHRLTGRLIRRGFSAEAVDLGWSRYCSREPSDLS